MSPSARAIIRQHVPRLRERLDDDDVRLAVARELLAVDPPRAALIRVQCFLASLGETRVPGYTWSPAGRSAAIDEEDGLLAAHGDRFREGELAAVDLPDFSRGFARRVVLVEAALARLPSLLELEPIFALKVSSATRGVTALLKSETISALYDLDLTGSPFDAEMAATLAANPHAGNLRVLRVADTPFDRTACEAILASPHLRRLGVLDARGCPFDPVSPGDVTHAGFGAWPTTSAEAQDLSARYGFRRWMRHEGDESVESLVREERRQR